MLAGCGASRPFEGRLGPTARLLAQPPPSRLAIAPPTNALLPSLSADTLAGALADDLTGSDIPAVVAKPQKRDWSLVIRAEVVNNQVVPSYDVLNEKGRRLGTSQGQPVPEQDWADGSPAVLRTAADTAAPHIADLLKSIDAAMRMSDPNSLVNRPIRVVLTGVTGAPGDGDTALARNLRLQLSNLGLVVQDTPGNADFAVEGRVKTGPGANKTEQVEIQWIVSDAHSERGRVVQLNDVPPGSLDKYWADVALVVAQEAAAGVKKVITNVADNGTVKQADTGPAPAAVAGAK